MVQICKAKLDVDKKVKCDEASHRNWRWKCSEKDIVDAESKTKFIEVEIEVKQYESHTTSDDESEEKSKEDICP